MSRQEFEALAARENEQNRDDDELFGSHMGVTFWHKFGTFPLHSVQMINFLNKSHEVCILEEASFVQVMLGSGLHVLLAGEDMADFLNVWRSGVNRGCYPI